MMRGREEEDEEIDWEAALESGGVSPTRYRVGRDVFGANSTNFQFFYFIFLPFVGYVNVINSAFISIFEDWREVNLGFC